MWWVFGGALAATVLVFAVGILHPGHQSKLIGAVVGVGMVALYPLMLSGALKPKPVPVALYVDQSGIYADDAPFVLRQDIAEAYIRPASDARASRVVGSNASFSITAPAWPLTVVLITRKGRALHIDPGGQGPAAGILTALGFPVTIDAPGYTSRASTRGRRWIIGGSVVTVLYIAALIGYAYYRSIGH